MSDHTNALDPKLWELTMAVVREMDAKAIEYLGRDGSPYLPRRRRRSVSKFEHGWPNVGSLTAADQVDAIAYAELFGATKDAIHPFAYEDVEALRDLITYVRTTPSILERTLPATSRSPEDATIKRILEYNVRDLPLSIFDRAKALGFEIDSAEVLDLYRQREKSWLAPELPYELVVPLVLTNLALEATFEIDDESRIELLDDNDLRQMSADYDITGVPGPVADAARFAIVVGMPPLLNPGEGRRVFIRENLPDTTRVDAVCEGLRIVSSTQTGWARVFRRPLGWADGWTNDLPAYTLLHSSRRYPGAFDDFAWLKPGTTVTREELDRLPTVTSALTSASHTTRLAARRLSTALVRDAPDDQLVDACIGLEALLGQKGAELSYRIALRAAVLLSSRSTDPLPAELVFRMARTVYARRSDLVHGSVSEKQAQFEVPSGAPIATNTVAVWLLRQVLQERLLRPGHWRVEDLDDQVLQALRSN
ncbi:hypothetical protein HP550_17500 [Cellulomonas humilata]|uniref:Apea-like HEPN domain-containing protein n=1 Tax=Cellulomonas humilata TaxID=144055 RepID=A0A7Y6A3I3_9CELL|nr:HEPN domain-containing protein [Cellulomonas humilata]NUU19047.1 hypothetical protein [Cellulomonas humilata]